MVILTFKGVRNSFIKKYFSRLEELFRTKKPINKRTLNMRDEKPWKQGAL
jgi:hypothetical protein